jgi:DNA-binding NarL/FixJ family response regulator
MKKHRTQTFSPFSALAPTSRFSEVKWYEINPRRLQFRKLAMQSPWAADVQKKLNFSRFMGAGKVLILDPSSLGRSALAGVVMSLGVKSSRVILVSTVADAYEMMNREMPAVLIGDEELNRAAPVSVFEKYRNATRAHSEKFLSVMLTKDAADGAIAEAARVDVDLILTKPFSVKSFKDALHRKINQKLDRPEYANAIRKTQKLILEGDIGSALETFQAARASIPASADSGHAKESYQFLSHLYDVLLKQKNYGGAYQVIRQMMPHFSNNSEKLAELFRLAVVTENHADLISYYSLFLACRKRSASLHATVSSSYVYAARACAKSSSPSLKLMHDLLIKAYLSSSPRDDARTQVLRQIIQICVQMGCTREARDYLRRMPGGLSSDAYQALDFFIASQRQNSGEVIDRGWRLISKGVQDPLIYEILISQLLSRGKQDPAEHLAHEAAKLWPEHSNRFRTLADAEVR